MPATHGPLVRYQCLHDCLSQTGRYWTKLELRQRCGDALRQRFDDPAIRDPSVRNFHNDIGRMKSGELGYTAPIAYCASNRGYYYTDPNFTIDGTLLTQGDWQNLNEAVSILSWAQHKAPFLHLEDTIFRLQRQVADRNIDLERILQFERTDIQRGREHLAGLYQSIRNRQCLYLTYQAFNMEEPETVLFSPLLLKSYNRRWFLGGIQHEEERIEVRALDRIIGFRSAPDRCRETPHLYYERWFQEMIGVTRWENSQLETVQIWVAQNLIPYWKSKPIHPTQLELTELRNDRGTVFQIRVYPNYELEMRLLGHGEGIEVLAPLALRKKIAQRLRDGLARYEQ